MNSTSCTLRVIGGFAAQVLAAAALFAPHAAAQIQDQIVLYGQDPVTGDQQMARYDRQFHWLSTTTFPTTFGNYQGDMVGIALDGQGRYWIPWDTLYQPLALVLSPAGSWVASHSFNEFPTDAVAGPSGDVYLRTRIPLSAPGPIYCVKPDGTIRWVSWDAVSPFNTGLPPTSIAVATNGDVYVGGRSNGLCACKVPFAAVARVDPQTGVKLATINIPKFGLGVEGVYDLEAAPDGGIWAFVSTASGFRFYKIEGSSVVRDFPAQGGYNGATWRPRIDGNGYIYEVSYSTGPWDSGSHILKLSPVDGTILADHALGRPIAGLALSPGGDEIFANTADLSTARYLDRVNLVTGVHSSLKIDPQFLVGSLPSGDPTGFLYANILNRAGDTDGDGVSDGDETAARTNPYDPTSVPWGPRVYLSWTNAGGLRLRYVEPDGLLSLTGGLVALDLQVEGYGDLLPFFGAYVSAVSFDPAFTDLTIEFDGFPIPPDLKLRFEARAQDATGAVGSDWAVSPPGTL